MDSLRTERDARETLPLPTAAEYLLDECRMVLPGIQALFGFQLISFFSPGFENKFRRRSRRRSGRSGNRRAAVSHPGHVLRGPLAAGR